MKIRRLLEDLRVRAYEATLKTYRPAAGVFQDEMERGLREHGYAVMRDVYLGSIEGRGAFVDLRTASPDLAWIELDFRSPRRNSLRKLAAVGAGRKFVVLRVPYHGSGVLEIR